MAFDTAPVESGRTSTAAITDTLAIRATWLPDGYAESTGVKANFFSFGSEPSNVEDPPRVFTVWTKDADTTPGTPNAIVLYADWVDRERSIARFGPKDPVATTGLRPGISVLVGTPSAARHELRWEEGSAAIKVVVLGDLDDASIKRFVRSLVIS